MGTRGAQGFRIGDKDKVTYNHCDSYPAWLGKNIINFVRSTPDEELNEIANKIVLVDGQKKPTKKQIKECQAAGLVNTAVASQSLTDWYCLTREAQGDLSVYKGDFKYMIDSSSFLIDSLFCEWAYIIDIDNMLLEFYRGYQETPNGNGRYAKMKLPDCDYFGVSMFRSVPLNEIRDIVDVDKYCLDMEKNSAV